MDLVYRSNLPMAVLGTRVASGPPAAPPVFATARSLLAVEIADLLSDPSPTIVLNLPYTLPPGTYTEYLAVVQCRFSVQYESFGVLPADIDVIVDPEGTSSIITRTIQVPVGPGSPLKLQTSDYGIMVQTPTPALDVTVSVVSSSSITTFNLAELTVSAHAIIYAR